MRKIFVSGCFDVVHGGHIEFFTQAKKLGTHLTVCIASDESLWIHKRKRPSLPVQHRIKVVQSLRIVDEAVVSTGLKKGLDFEPELLALRPDVLAVTEDDKYREEKIALCKENGVAYVSLPKTLDYEKTSTSDILSFIRAPTEVPLRVDFAGGWLDVPKYARPDSFVVNCTVTPMVSLREWGYKQGAGLGGSAAYAFLTGENSFKKELAMGVGWQDPVAIAETGLCAWRAFPKPVLDVKKNPVILINKMALLWTGEAHYSPGFVDNQRDFGMIIEAGVVARRAVLEQSFQQLCEAVKLSYAVQIKEGMKELPSFGEAAKKYGGGGFGGYALYLFSDPQDRIRLLDEEGSLLIEPYIRTYSLDGQ